MGFDYEELRFFIKKLKIKKFFSCSKTFATPEELSPGMDAETLVMAQLAAISQKDEPRLAVLEEQWKKTGAKPREAFRVLSEFQDNPDANQLIDRLLQPYTLQRQVRELFEGGLFVKGYTLFKTLFERGDITEYIVEKYFPCIFQAQVEMKEWDRLTRHLASPKTLWSSFEVYRKLNVTQQKELRSHLDDEKNLLAEFLIDSEGSSVDEWTDELIDDWINPDLLHDPIILGTPAFYRRDAIRNLLYYSHGDPRYRRTDEMIIWVPMTPGAQNPIKEQNVEETLATFRGDEKEFEERLIQLIRETIKSDGFDIHADDGVELLQKYVDIGEGEFYLGQVLNIPFHQYPDLVQKYGPFIRFVDRALTSSDLETIFDLIDYQDNLQALRNMAKTEKKLMGWYGGDFIFDYYGVKL